MAAALNTHEPEDLSLSISPGNSLTHPDFSLGSFASGVSTPHRSNVLRPPRTSLAPPNGGSTNGATPLGPRRTKNVGDYASLLDETDEGVDLNASVGADMPDTPGPATGMKGILGRTRSGTLTGGSTASTTNTNGASSTTTKVSKLTLREQEKHIDSLKKENFSIKLRVHFLEDQLARLAPDQMEAALKQNINLKIEVQQRGMEIKKLKKLVLSLEHELERSQRNAAQAASSANSSQRERELEELLRERELELRELRRRKAEKADDDDMFVREAESRNRELEEELDNVKGLLEENMDEITRLQELLERRGGDANASGSGSRSALQARVEQLESENADLKEKLAERDDLINQLQDDRDDLTDALNELQLRLEDLQQRRQHESLERSQSRAALLSEQEEREELEEELNQLRDRVAALMIEVQSKEDELERVKGQIEVLHEEHKQIVDEVENEWRGEVEEARGQADELKDVLAERDQECQDLRAKVTDFEAETDAMHAKYEDALHQLEEELHEKERLLEDRERELDEKEDEMERRELEIESARGTIDKLGEQIYELEDENDRLKEDVDRTRDEEGMERDRLEAVVAALKEKNAALKAELQDLNDAYSQAKRDLEHHLSKQEELAQHIEALVNELEAERSAHKISSQELASLNKQFDAQSAAHRRALDAKERELQQALMDLDRADGRLKEREVDLERLQEALRDVEKERAKLGESATTAKFSLQLEVDRLKRDLERAEDELSRLRTELASREAAYRDREGTMEKLHSDNRDLASELAAQTQARLNLSEKLDEAQKSLKEKESEVSSLRARLNDVEGRLSKDSRALVQAEGMYRDQLTERNTLLLTIYQYLDKILGVEKTPKKGSAGETKPFTNFSVFHDNLITRLKALSQIQLDFDKRAKEVESRFTDKLGEMRRQLDSRWRQIDKFEQSVKLVGEAKAGWRRKLKEKEGEAEALKANNSDLSAQVSLLKRTNPADHSELRSLTARAMNAERRLNNAQNQLLASEEKLAALNARTTTADEKWEARVREYESRLRAAEEKVKRERQGGKERVAELEGVVKKLNREVEEAKKRNVQVGEIVETAERRKSSPRGGR